MHFLSPEEIMEKFGGSFSDKEKKSFWKWREEGNQFLQPFAERIVRSQEVGFPRSADSVLRDWREGLKILVVEFTAADIACIPYASDGKFRLHRCSVVGEKDLAAIGVVDAPPPVEPEPVKVTTKKRAPRKAVVK